MPVPKHLAIIMDGNGRWAKSKGWPRLKGHQEGAKRVDEIVEECTRLGISYLSLYTFSTENWKRPAEEVGFLWDLLLLYLNRMRKKLLDNRVALVAQGGLDHLPTQVIEALSDVMKATQISNPRLILNLCLSYGGRQEIVDATRKIAKDVLEGRLALSEISESSFRDYLYRPEIPDPDLLVRTGGDYRISNFLLWEVAYTELYITPVCWPQFGPKELGEALKDFSSRQRRYGMTSEQITTARELM